MILKLDFFKNKLNKKKKLFVSTVQMEKIICFIFKKIAVTCDFTAGSVSNCESSLYLRRLRSYCAMESWLDLRAT